MQRMGGFDHYGNSKGLYWGEGVTRVQKGQ